MIFAFFSLELVSRASCASAAALEFLQQTYIHVTNKAALDYILLSKAELELEYLSHETSTSRVAFQDLKHVVQPSFMPTIL